MSTPVVKHRRIVRVVPHVFDIGQREGTPYQEYELRLLVDGKPVVESVIEFGAYTRGVPDLVLIAAVMRATKQLLERAPSVAQFGITQ